MTEATEPGTPPRAVQVTPVAANPVLEQATQDFLDQISTMGEFPLYAAPDAKDRVRLSDLQMTESDEFAVTVEDRSLPFGPTQSINLRIVRPLHYTGALPALVYFPGCGWVAGSRKTHDRLIREIAAGAGIAVVFVEYAHAPEARFPVQLEQGYATLEHLLENGPSMGIDGSTLAVGGDGAGGNIAAVLCILARKRRLRGVVFQLLLYPITGNGPDTPSQREFREGPWLTRTALDRFLHAYCGETSVDDVTAFPLNAPIRQLENLAPALVITAENDILRDEAEAYARKLMRAGVAVSSTRYLGTIHDFLLIDRISETPAARAAMSQVLFSLRAALKHG